jgi:hypothetical protein
MSLKIMFHILLRKIRRIVVKVVHLMLMGFSLLDNVHLAVAS